ncbi:MAG: nucleic acid-binding protein [Cyanobacteria bacterium P01_D01_bin.1]
MILCDTGPLLCLVDRTQPQHNAYATTIAQLEKPLVTTWACFVEAMHLAGSRGGWAMQKQLSTLLIDKLLTINSVQESDYTRLFYIMEKYQDRPMDSADATLVLTAEKIRETRILTLDSDFLFYQINERESFDIIAT